ncbi:MAG TPA: hypothetical protein VFK89_12815, partial [Actinomycetota bacterium]|nr:hypothetical protein [Actinomycetota bacterium]
MTNDRERDHHLEDDAGIVAEEPRHSRDDVIAEETGVVAAPSEGDATTLIVSEEAARAKSTEPKTAATRRDVVAPARRFRVRVPRLGRKSLIALGVAVLLAFSGVAYATYDYDQHYDGKILPGITVGGVDVGGMTRHEALAAVEAASR